MMRILMGVFVLVALPFLASVAQQPDQGDQNSQQCESDGNDGTECDEETPPPPPPSTCGPSVSAPTATISGSVIKLGVGVSGACIQVFVGTTLTAGAVTDPAGSYSIGVAPPSTGATFLVCLVAPPGSTQTSPLVTSGFPTCPSGAAGFSPPLVPGGSAQFVTFTL